MTASLQLAIYALIIQSTWNPCTPLPFPWYCLIPPCLCNWSLLEHFLYSPYLASLPWSSKLNSDIFSNNLPYNSRVGHKKVVFCARMKLCAGLSPCGGTLKGSVYGILEYRFLKKNKDCTSFISKPRTLSKRPGSLHSKCVSNWTISCISRTFLWRGPSVGPGMEVYLDYWTTGRTEELSKSMWISWLLSTFSAAKCPVSEAILTSPLFLASSQWDLPVTRQNICPQRVRFLGHKVRYKCCKRRHSRGFSVTGWIACSWNSQKRLPRIRDTPDNLGQWLRFWKVDIGKRWKGTGDDRVQPEETLRAEWGEPWVDVGNESFPDGSQLDANMTYFPLCTPPFCSSPHNSFL